MKSANTVIISDDRNTPLTPVTAANRHHHLMKISRMESKRRIQYQRDQRKSKDEFLNEFLNATQIRCNCYTIPADCSKPSVDLLPSYAFFVIAYKGKAF